MSTPNSAPNDHQNLESTSLDITGTAKASLSDEKSSETPSEMNACADENRITPAELEAAQKAAADWASETFPSETPAHEKVTLISDPFQISTLEIAEIQNRLENGDFDENDGFDEDFNDDDFDEDDLEVDEIKVSDMKREIAEAAKAERKEYKEYLEDTSNNTDSDELTISETQFIEQLDKIASAMGNEEQHHIVELEALSEVTAQESAERLAREISEDEALTAMHALETAALEEELETDAELQAALPKITGTELDIVEIESCIETLLFLSDKPMKAEKLHELLGPEFDFSLFQEALTSLQKRYEEINHGIELAEINGGYQLRTKPGRAALAKKLAKVTQQRLSGGAMETLAIAAYKQPVLKDDIDSIRGVDSSHFIRGLLDKKLLKISGRSELPGRPMLYETTEEFLELFSLPSLDAMPALKELEQMIPQSESEAANEDPRVKEMRKLVLQMKSDQSTLLNYDPKEDEKILKEIKDRVSAIPTSTAYLDGQKAAEKAAAEAAKLGLQGLTTAEPTKPLGEESSLIAQPSEETPPLSESHQA